MAAADHGGAWLREFFSRDGPGRTMLRLRKGEALYKKGGDATRVFMVQRGQIGLVDKARTLEVVGPNRWLFESAHELAHHFLHDAVALVEDTRVMAFQSNNFLDLLAQYPVLNAKFVEDMAERVTERNNNDPAAKRLARHLLKILNGREALIIETAPKSLGIQIGATRQRVTDILKVFHKSGMAVKISTGKYRLSKLALSMFLGAESGDDR
jgi:CRP-like cAMP-binding protein